ncbi:hypothetical protein E2C01_090272 [Portunus trituberculatus]|uniref:Uncharacterized protein n=1 Tax=Portunus trituberculatus TaxID=210409 RepID=A0A5B7JLD7_PORTR|nr:hypothetical protein [Portunus trituberculatus]
MREPTNHQSCRSHPKLVLLAVLYILSVHPDTQSGPIAFSTSTCNNSNSMYCFMKEF